MRPQDTPALTIEIEGLLCRPEVNFLFLTTSLSRDVNKSGTRGRQVQEISNPNQNSNLQADFLKGSTHTQIETHPFINPTHRVGQFPSWLVCMGFLHQEPILKLQANSNLIIVVQFGNYLNLKHYNQLKLFMYTVNLINQLEKTNSNEDFLY